MFIHTINRIRQTVAGVKEKCLRSFVKTTPSNVADAMIRANGKLYANPQASLWGFMTLIQIHISAPIYGRFRINGSEPTTIRVMSRSLIDWNSLVVRA
jgi:hypothetical protein